MYQNLIRQTSAANNPKLLSIRLHGIPFNEKAAYVESVCSSLMDSRFGPGRSRPLAIRITQWPELEPAVFYDVTPAGPVPSFSILPDSEMAKRHSADIIRRELTPANPFKTTIHIQPGQPPNQGRGSP